MIAEKSSARSERNAFFLGCSGPDSSKCTWRARDKADCREETAQHVALVICFSIVGRKLRIRSWRL